MLASCILTATAFVVVYPEITILEYSPFPSFLNWNASISRGFPASVTVPAALLSVMFDTFGKKALLTLFDSISIPKFPVPTW
ncbi:hypothetical protein D3C84_1217120 [compost metagenome]